MEISDTAQLQSIIAASPAVLLYFYNDNCAPCQVLRPKVMSMMETMFPRLEIVFVNSIHTLAAQFGIFSSPAILVIFDGKEVIREGKFVSIEELQGKIARYYSLFFE